MVPCGWNHYCYDILYVCTGIGVLLHRQTEVKLKNRKMYEDNDYEYDFERFGSYGSYDDGYGTHYGKYAGTYAQEVAGYSDEVIDDVFEGDPDAYWNID